MKVASNSAKLNFLNRLRFTGCKENCLRALFMKSSVTVFEMPMKRFSPGSQSNSSIGTEVESENNTQTESGYTQGRGRGGTRAHGRGHTTQRGQSEERSERYKSRRDREKGKCWCRVKITWTRTWERTVEEYAEGKDWCGRRGCRTKTG